MLSLSSSNGVREFPRHWLMFLADVSSSKASRGGTDGCGVVFVILRKARAVILGEPEFCRQIVNPSSKSMRLGWGWGVGGHLTPGYLPRAAAVV